MTKELGSDSPQRKGRRQSVGKNGERFAAAYLEQAGYVIANRNWRCRTGEIDLIAEHRGVCVFIEVRTRTFPGRFGTAKESIDWRKCRQVRETATVYLHATNGHHRKTRFDVIAVELDPNGELLRLEHVEGAF